MYTRPSSRNEGDDGMLRIPEFRFGRRWIKIERLRVAAEYAECPL
jgi:hypothetical protein